MRYYLGHCGTFLKPMNKLQAAIQKMFLTYDGVLIRESDINKTKHAITQNVQTLNRLYPRCTPEQVSFFCPDEFSELVDWIAAGVHCVSFAFYHSRDFNC